MHAAYLDTDLRGEGGAPGAETLDTEVCVVGGGPGGLALALELALRGRRAVVVEQKAGVERSFRGESLSPDAVWLLDRLGLMARLRPDALATRRLEIHDGGRRVLRADFGAAGWPSPLPMEITQPAMLAAIHERARDLPRLRIEHGRTATALLRGRDGRVVGVRCEGVRGRLDVRAALTVAADGRYSRLRPLAGLQAAEIPLNRDFVWFKVPRPTTWDPHTYQVRLVKGANCALIPTVPDQLRIGFNIPKGQLRALRAQGIGALHERIALLAPELAETVREHVVDWSGTAALDIFTALVPDWSAPGFVLIGDAAHTLSPILGLGVHHALLDAAVLAPLAARALDATRPGEAVDEAVDEAAREFQRVREPSVELSRSLQLRQERAFGLTRPGAVAVRRGVYRLVNRLAPVKRRLMTKVYYSVQQEALGGPRPLEPLPAASAARPTTSTGWTHDRDR